MTLLKDILTYAYRGGGKYVLIICAALSLVGKLAAFAPIIGLMAILLLSAYFSATYFQMIQSSATGGKEAPEFPDVTNWFEDLIQPMLQIIAVVVVSFGPLICHALWVDEGYTSPWIGFCLVGLGVIYFPMAMLAVVVLGHTMALSPHIVIPAIFRAGWLYWVGVVMLCLLYLTSSWVEEVFSGSLILGSLVMAIAGAYTFMTNARILGVVFRERQDELGWF